MIGRIVIENIRPSTPSGIYPAKAVTGIDVTVSADIFREGHDLLAARVRWRHQNQPWQTVEMSLSWGDRWTGSFLPGSLGLHEFVIEAWTDVYATWVSDATVKHGAGQDISVELEEGALLVEDRFTDATPGERELCAGVPGALRDSSSPPGTRLAAGMGPHVAELFRRHPPQWDFTASPPLEVWVDRPLGQTGAWYELFPRSEGGLEGTAKRLDAIAGMGFDIVYLPPIHPIGRKHRKGRNASLVAGPDDPGSPWAIGGPEGGHTAIHPDLGTFEDFAALLEKAENLGMEIALDYALQCSADHPWLTEHPEWFHHRPDGTIKYAENPPKKYQDIYPLKFWPPEEQQPLWEACREILEFWIARGVKVFRVDNPHTKPVPFWAWVIREVKSLHPEVIFLAEAFTEARMMAKLSEVGFTQSYTNFAWMLTKEQLIEYVTEVALGPKSDYMRPNFWPNTPDILTGPLRWGPPAAFKQRLVLAATMSPSYGIYNGYELCENEPVGPNAEAGEDYLDSEKFEIKHRNWDMPGNLSGYIRRVNDLRRTHPCFRRLTNIRFHDTSNRHVIAYSKAALDLGDALLTVVNLEPHEAQDSEVALEPEALGLKGSGPFGAFDELNEKSFDWESARPVIRLDPGANPAAIFRVTDGQ